MRSRALGARALGATSATSALARDADDVPVHIMSIGNYPNVSASPPAWSARQ